MGSMAGPPGRIVRSIPASLKYPLAMPTMSPAIWLLRNHPICTDARAGGCALAGATAPPNRPPAPSPSAHAPLSLTRVLRLKRRAITVTLSRSTNTTPLSLHQAWPVRSANGVNRSPGGNERVDMPVSCLGGLGHEAQFVGHDLFGLDGAGHLVQRDIRVTQLRPDLGIHVPPSMLLGGNGGEVIVHVLNRLHVERPVETG